MPSVAAASTSTATASTGVRADAHGAPTELVQRHAAAQPWHNSQAHRFIRKLMILRLRRLYPALAVPSSPPSNAPASSTPRLTVVGQPAAATLVVPQPSGARASLAQRLEWMLYHAAFSMEEYGNQRTLERRIRALATHIEPTATALARLSGAKRSNEVLCCVDLEGERAAKKQRQEPVQHSETESELFLGNDQCLVAHVMSFLDGTDVLRCRAVNRFLSHAAPSMVHSLGLTARVPGLQALPDGYLSSLLRQCSNLTALTIGNRLNQVDLPAPQLQASVSTTLSGSARSLCSARRVLREVASALQAGACASMRSLVLDAPMDHLVESTEVVKVVEALVAGRERLRAAGNKVAPLKQLVLDATFLGDRKVERIAGLMRRGETHALESVVLSNNYIGAGGCRALMDVLPTFPGLRSLDLGCNILTDLDAIALADALDGSLAKQYSGGSDSERAIASQRPVQLRSLCLDDNFIDQPGREALRAAPGLQHCQISTARPSAAARSRSRKFGLVGLSRSCH